MPLSPSVDNYHIGKGVVTFLDDDSETTEPRDLGNAPSFSYAADIQTKEHFSSRFGVKTKDVTRVTQVGAKITLLLEEITGENLALWFLSEIETNTDGSVTLRGLSKTTFTGVLSVTGANDVGQQLDWTGRVSFIPSGDFRFITDGDDYSQLEVTADVLADDDGNFGVLTVRDTTDD